jgi:Domain of unknown function (DUF4412)
MKALLSNCFGIVLLSAVFSAQAQRPGMGGPPGASFNGAMAKLFGDNANFSATMEQHMKTSATEDPMEFRGKMASSDGNFRIEMDMSTITNPKMAGAADRMKKMGMSKMVIITKPDKKVMDMIFPDLQAYVEQPLTDPESSKPVTDFKIEMTELGKEDFDGHPCVKNKAVVTDSQGQKHESTLWNATDLHKFPIKIEQPMEGRGGGSMTLLFKNIELSKPEASMFEAPSGFTKYDSQMAMMQSVMMKRRPPGQ